MKESNWNSSRDILTAIHEQTIALKNGEIDVNEAHAFARLMGSAVRMLDVSLEHARLTGRIKQGSNEMPSFKIASSGG